MKNLLLRISFVLLLSIMISCNKEEFKETNSFESVNSTKKKGDVIDNSSSKQNFSQRSSIRFTAEQFNFVGVEHNQIVDEIKQTLLVDLTSTNDLQESMETFINIKVFEKYQNQEDLQIASTLVNQYMHTKPNYTTSLYNHIENNNIISNNAKLYLDKLLQIMLEENASIITITLKINNLENEAYNDQSISNDDLLIIYPATSVAKNSLYYWSENFSTWEKLIPHENFASKEKPKTPGRRCAEIAVADVAGAVGGAAAAWAVNVWIGPGQIAYAGAIIGGAVGSSATSAVCHIAESIFRW